jgi:hypothetical protein
VQADLVVSGVNGGGCGDRLHCQAGEADPSPCQAAGGVVLVVDVADTAANITTFGWRIIRLADLTTDPPSVLGLCNGYSLFAQYFENRW